MRYTQRVVQCELASKAYTQQKVSADAINVSSKHFMWFASCGPCSSKHDLKSSVNVYFNNFHHQVHLPVLLFLATSDSPCKIRSLSNLNSCGRNLMGIWLADSSTKCLSFHLKTKNNLVNMQEIYNILLI